MLDRKDNGSSFIKVRDYNAWQLITLFWKSENKAYAYTFYSIMVIMTMAMVGFDVAFSYWSNYFYNALQAYDKNGVLFWLMVFCVLATIHIVIAVYRYYVSQLFGLRWRKWLTIQFINRWLEKRDYYYLENFDKRTDNPDQRIQDDVGSLVISFINLSLGFISSITTFLAFIFVLWQLSGVIVLPLGPLGTWHIPGYLVWVAVIYAVFGSYFTYKIGNPLVNLNFEQQRREATFRYAAIDLRSNSENVALYRGEKHQKNILGKFLDSVLQNWFMIVLRQKLLLWFTAGYNQIAVILPLVVALPNYFSKKFLLGGVMQSLRAFGSIQDALSFFVNSYTQIAEWQAVMNRLTTFINHLNEIDGKAMKANHLRFSQDKENKIVASKVNIETPENEPLLNNIQEEFLHGRHYLIKGVSGIGKSTFVRTLAGIWPFASGEISLPLTQNVMYLPQKPYMPIGTLADALLYPDKTQHKKAEKLKKILQDVHLDHLIPRLHESAAWSEQLSPGELQRVAFARVLLQKPDWVFLDETTSMLDLNNEKYLYHLLKTQLPQCSIVSVGHRPSLDLFHDYIIDIAKYQPQVV